MLTVGVDLAAESTRTALAVVDLDSHGAAITELNRGADDEVILAALARAVKAGIDCQPGWPDAFVTFVADHQSGDLAVPAGLTGQQWRRQLALKRERTLLLENIPRALDEGQAEWPMNLVTGMYVFGSFARGALEPQPAIPQEMIRRLLSATCSPCPRR
jgi:hypothetical protein